MEIHYKKKSKGNTTVLVETRISIKTGIISLLVKLFG